MHPMLVQEKKNRNHYNLYLKIPKGLAICSTDYLYLWGLNKAAEKKED